MEYQSNVCAMLTDFYQITIAKGQWDQGRQDEPAVFDLFYRVQPFNGTFAIFAGLNEAISFVKNYKFTEAQLEYISNQLGASSHPDFINWLRNLDSKKLKIVAPKEGTIIFPREPLLRIEGPLGLCCLIETPLLNAINFATLITTNASRIRLLAGNRRLMEFGLRRAQGPDGAMSASRYSFMGGFDATSNILAGHQFNIPISGTVAHSFVTSFTSASQLRTTFLPHLQTKQPVNILEAAHQYLHENNLHTNESELVAFVAQALSYPNNFLALVDTYDTIGSGVPNFLAVAFGLHKAGYQAKGIRLDSGDLATLSKQTRALYKAFAAKYSIPYAANFFITASNDINEEALLEFAKVGHEMDSYGIGTHLVTCQKQPALGGVYKLVQINGSARVKLSDEVIKSTLPAKKNLFRLYDAQGKEVIDLLTLDGESLEPGTITVHEVYPKSSEMRVEFARAECMYDSVWENGVERIDSLAVAKQRVTQQVATFRKDVVKIVEPTAYKVAISEKLNGILISLTKEAKGK